MGSGVKQCAGCGIAAKQHPWIAVVSENGVFTDVPVCDPCHKDPEHRTLAPIKGHFFPHEFAADAVSKAGSASIGGPIR